MFNFRLGAIPVRVQPYFLISSVLLNLHDPPLRIALWVLIVFVSVMIHELGHALVGMALGYRAAIELTGFVGLTYLSPKAPARGAPPGSTPPELRSSPWRNFLVSLAGPVAGFLFGGLVFAADRLGLVPPGDLPAWLVSNLLFVNIFWGIFNLLPMIPLDGGHVATSILTGIFGGRGVRFASYLSIAVAVLGGLYALRSGALMAGIIAVNSVMINLRILRAPKPAEAPPFDEEAAAGLLREGFAALSQGDGHAAIGRAETVLGQRPPKAIFVEAVRLLARGRLLEGQWDALFHLLAATREELGPEELALFEKSARQIDRPELADRIAELRAATS